MASAGAEARQALSLTGMEVADGYGHAGPWIGRRRQPLWCQDLRMSLKVPVCRVLPYVGKLRMSRRSVLGPFSKGPGWRRLP